MRRSPVHAIAVIALLLGAANPALAAFPGVNGPIAYIPWHSSGAVFLTGTGQLVGATNADTDPVFSPDGSRVAFVAKGSDGRNHIFVIRKDGTQLRDVIGANVFGTGAFIGNPAWTPDGQGISFDVASADPSSNGIWTVRLDGEGERTRTVPVGQFPKWSSARNEMVYSCVSGFCVYNAKTRQIRQLPIQWPDSSAPGRPEWSPDGSRIVFAMSWGVQPDPHNEIFTMGPYGGGLTQITNGGPATCTSNPQGVPPTKYPPVFHFEPTYSPDGQQILFDGHTMVQEPYPHQPTKTDCVPRDGGIWSLGGLLIPNAGSPDWGPVPANLTVQVHDGHNDYDGPANPLVGLKVEVCTTAGCPPEGTGTVVNSNPYKSGGGYGFDVAAGDYVVRATLIDDPSGGATPAFSIENAVDTPSQLKPIKDPVWIERNVTVLGGTPVIFNFPFDDSGALAATSVDSNPEHRNRLDDMANIYFRMHQFVDWLHGSLTSNTGPMVRFWTFAVTDPTDGGDVTSKGGAYYWSAHNAVVMDIPFSEYQSRDGGLNILGPDPGPGHSDGFEHGPWVEWHEFTHHFFDKSVISSDCPEDLAWHSGYSNKTTCSSLNEGFATFLPALAGQTILGTSNGKYMMFVHIEPQWKAWDVGFDKDETGATTTSFHEELAVAGIFWDLVDANADTESNTQAINNPGDHVSVTYTDTTSMPLSAIWISMIVNRPETVRELWEEVLNFQPISEDLDGDGEADVTPIDELFLMHGFFPIDNEQNIGHKPRHYDMGAAELVGLPRNGLVSRSDHYVAHPPPTKTFIPRSTTPLNPNASVALDVRDASGTPLAGATVELTIQYPGSRLSRSRDASATAMARSCISSCRRTSTISLTPARLRRAIRRPTAASRCR